MKRIFLDFETRSRINLKNNSTFEYASHPTTEIMMLGWKYEQESKINICSPPCYWWSKHYNDPLPVITPDTQLVAHNAAFDYLIWQQTGIHFLDRAPLEQWSCTKAMAKYIGFKNASLKNLCRHFGVTEKIAEGDSLIQKLCIPQDGGSFFEGEEEIHSFANYLKGDVQSLSELYPELKEVAPNWEEEELKHFHNTIRINNRGVPFSESKTKNIDFLAESMKRVYDFKISSLTNDIVKTPREKINVDIINAQLQRKGFKLKRIENCKASDKRGENISSEYIRGQGAEELNLIRKHPEYHAPQHTKFKDYIETLVSSSDSATTKCKRILAGDVKPESEIRWKYELLQYYDTQVGSFSGSGVQPQNFKRTDPVVKDLFFKEKIRDLKSLQDLSKRLNKYPLEILGSSMRQLIQAPSGNSFFVSDYSGLQFRIALWLAKDPGIKLIEQGVDPYVEYAKNLFQRDEITDEERYNCKQLSLACVFGQGWRGARISLSEAGVIMTPKEVQHGRQVFLETFPKLVDFHAYLRALLLSNEGEEQMNVTLPSGRTLMFFDIRKSFMGIKNWRNQTVDTKHRLTWKTGPDAKRSICWHGSLFQNICNGTNADILRFGIDNLENSGWTHPVFHIHDEVVSLVVDGRITKEKEEEYQKLLGNKVGIPWAKGLPIDTKFYCSKTFQ